MKTSKHSLSHYKLATMDMGELIPISCYEVLPGDTFRHSTSALIRLSPMQKPVMHPIWCRIHHWFVPYRILWAGFEDFITSKDLTIQFPFVNGAGNDVGGLADYLNAFDTTLPINVLPFLAYQMIWAKFYADEQLQSDDIEAIETLLNQYNSPLGSRYNTPPQAISAVANTLRRVSWFKDYFTTARPSPQLGPEVSIDSFENQNQFVADVIRTAFPAGWAPASDSSPSAQPLTAVRGIIDIKASQTNGSFQALTSSNNPLEPGQSVYGDVWPRGLDISQPDPYADLVQKKGFDSSLGQMNISSLMAGFALQRILQHRNAYGYRFDEYLRALGVNYSNKALQLPQYLGGGKTLIQISEVLNTAQSTGEMFGHGIASLKSPAFTKYFEEHGIVLSLMSIIPKNMYSQQLHRMWYRPTAHDFWQPEMQHLDMQGILNRELYSKAADSASIFGYQNRYDEYRSIPSSVSGNFRTTENDWHLAREFAAQPVLNSSFIECNPSKRIFQEQTEDEIYVMAKHKIVARRHIIKRANPKIL